MGVSGSMEVVSILPPWWDVCMYVCVDVGIYMNYRSYILLWGLSVNF